jgi:phosphoglycolate phosphatase
MRLAVFDLDGTLADTAEDLLAAANAALEHGGRDARLGVAGDSATAFAGGRAMLRAGLGRDGAAWDEAEVDRLYPVLLEAYGAAIDTHTRLYDGAEAALDRLAGRGWGLAICTNKPEALAETLLVRLGVRSRFAAMLGADSLAFRKPDPRHLLETIRLAGGSRDRAVLVGDTVTDRDTARAAGVPCVLVGFGPVGAGVAALEPEALLPHYDDLDAILERLVPDGAIPA